VTGGGSAYAVHAGKSDVFTGTDQLSETAGETVPEDALEAWSAERDRHWGGLPSSRYVSPDVVGGEDLDDYGSWQQTPDYGYVWFPRGVPADWAPYHSGHWSYIEPWGYTWVDDQPWGFAPFHYGRWSFFHGAWGWIPARPRAVGVVYERPVYAPALVAWVGAGAAIAWFALGPREVFVPSYPVSRTYVNQINVTNTTVNTTVINNVYNTTIINNRTVNATNITYANRNVPGAVAATTSQAFTTAQPISRNRVNIDIHALASAPVRGIAPSVVPTRQAVLGSGRMGGAKPPAALQNRPVVARVSPPPPPPPFEKRRAAIESNGGKPLSIPQVRQLQPGEARNTAVRVAPPAMPFNAAPTAHPTPNVPVRTDRPPSASPPAAAAARAGAVPPGPASPANRSATAAVHPRELPSPPKPSSPSAAESAIERQHLQQQQQLRAEQEAERQRVQQQQELQHQQLQKQQADAARRQQLEQQHQQETRQLQQRQMEQAQQLQEHQRQQQQQLQLQQQRQQQAPKREPPPPPPRPPGRPPESH
jgi:flagellar biosynthesis GTPase FlhF